MTAVVDRPGIYADIPEADYHADTPPVPELGRSLSSSGLRTLLVNPARYQWEREHGTSSTEAMDFGRVAHARLLGVGGDIEVIDADSWTLRATREQRDAAVAAGRTPILRRDSDRADELVDAVRSHPVAGLLFDYGEPERSIYWQDEATGVLCRARVDWLRPDMLVDLKTTIDADRGFSTSAARFGYYLQAEWYSRGVEAVTGKRLPFVVVAVEKTPPYPLRVWRMDNPFALEAAGIRNDRAVELFAKCESDGEWPSYSEEIETLDPPDWWIREMGAEL